MAEFARVPMPGGGERVDMTRLTNGQIMCCVCFEYFTRDQLEPVDDEPGKVWDVCRVCYPSTIPPAQGATP